MDVLIVVGALFAGAGALLFAAGLALRRSGRRFDRDAQRAPGQVVGTRAAGGSTSGLRYPVLQFTLPDGRSVETVARTTTSLDALQEGRAVTVLYDPDDPRRARIATSAGPALLTGVFMVIGGVFVLLGLALMAGGIALRDALPEQ